MFKPFFSLLIVLISTGILSGCTTFGAIINIEKNIGTDNVKVSDKAKDKALMPYSIQSVMTQKPLGRATLVLAFSGGGSSQKAITHSRLSFLRCSPM